MFIDSFQTSWEGKKLKSTILKNQNLSYITISKNMTLIKLWQYWTSYLMTYKQISVWLEHVSQTDLCLFYIVNALAQNSDTRLLFMHFIMCCKVLEILWVLQYLSFENFEKFHNFKNCCSGSESSNAHLTILKIIFIIHWLL